MVYCTIYAKLTFTKQEMRNVKENDKWVQKPYYIIDDKLCYGHGEGSVKGGSYSMSGAWSKYPLGAMLHCADLMASYLDEREEK